MSLVSTKEMFEKAYEGGYAIGAFNINNMEIIQGIMEAVNELRSPVILQASASARKYAGPTYLKKLVEAAVFESEMPVALHLDHGETFEICKECIEDGFTSVMIDGSALSFEENVELTKKVVDYAHRYNVTVEGELGCLAGIENGIEVTQERSFYTDPEQAKEFVNLTGVDSLAVAIGTSHGAYKFKFGQKPQLRFDILEKIEQLLPGLPIVLHGASSVMPKYVEEVNYYGGVLGEAIGIPEEVLRQAIEISVCKINIDSDLRLAMTSAIRKQMNLHPENFDPRSYLGAARAAIKDVVRHKIENVLGSSGKV